VKTLIPFTCALAICLGGCAGTGRQISAVPPAPEADLAGAPTQPEEPPPVKVVSRWRHRLDLCAGRVRDDLGLVATKVPACLETAADADVTQCLLPPLCVAGYVVACFTGQGGGLPDFDWSALAAKP
jgi:hypothetical protein